MKLYLSKNHRNPEDMVDIGPDAENVYASILKDCFSFEILTELNCHDMLECELITSYDYLDLINNQN